MTKSRSSTAEPSKISFRLFPPYGEKIAELASEAKLTPNQLARVATMAMVDSGLLNLSERFAFFEMELRELKDLICCAEADPLIGYGD